ncbi:MAG: hypothetical protein KatS3mg071_1956 [Meiothermus sp.]|nr:MAG: hypothetical protein KatS3mg071_1956 [Meiothermus sp.]
MNTTSTPKVSLKAVALPNEHGGWGFTLEPVLLGLLVAPSGAGLGLGLFALAAFFTRHPLKLWLSDLRRGRNFPRTALARNLALLYGLLALAGLILAVWWATGPFWIPLLLALPLVGVQLWFDAHNRGRNLLPELAGAVAMGSVAASIGLAGGLEAGPALGLWLVLAMRSMAAIYYARAQVRRARGKSVNLVAVYLAEVFAVAVLIVGTRVGLLVPWPSIVALAMLIPLSLYTFSKTPVPARVVGWTQMAFGLLIVGCTWLGLRLG